MLVTGGGEGKANSALDVSVPLPSLCQCGAVDLLSYPQPGNQATAREPLQFWHSASPYMGTSFPYFHQHVSMGTTSPSNHISLGKGERSLAKHLFQVVVVPLQGRLLLLLLRHWWRLRCRACVVRANRLARDIQAIPRVLDLLLGL